MPLKRKPNPHRAIANRNARGVTTKRAFTAGKSRIHSISKADDNERGDPLILIPGEYPIMSSGGQFIEDPSERPVDAWFGSLTHGLKLGKKYRTAVCSAGYDSMRPRSCVYCYANDQKMENVGPIREKYSITVLHLAEYIKVTVKDRDTDKPIQKKSGDGFAFWWNQLPRDKGDRAKLVEEAKKYHGTKPSDYMKFGHTKYLELGGVHYSAITQYGVDLANTCGSCGGELLAVSIMCHSCNEIMMAGQSPEDIIRSYQGLARCPKCGGDVDNVVLDYECVDCNEPEPVDIYSTVIFLRRDGEGAQTKVTMVRTRAMEKFSIPDQYKNDDGDGVPEMLAKIEPFDFSKMVVPDTLAKQSEALGIPNPYAESGSSDYDEKDNVGYGKED
jgi:hypothetical protein